MQLTKNNHNRRDFLRQSAVLTTGIFIFPGCFPGQPRTSFPLELIKDGASNYVVVLNSGADPSEKKAAEQLVEYIKTCTGVGLQRERGLQKKYSGKKMIALGFGDVTEGFGVRADADELRKQGYLMKTVGDHLVIAGNTGKGTLYGVYHFLEHYLGMRWYAPGVTRVPEVSKLTVPPVDQTTTPSILYHEPRYTWPGKDEDFRNHLRINHGKWGGLGSDYFDFVSPKEFYNNHPEYFSEIGGKRIREETQLCLTNPDVFEIVAEGMLEKMRANPESRAYNFFAMDYYNYCQCENCRDVNEQYGSDGATQFDFVNRLAERTSKEFPDKLIGTLAYTYTEKPPVGMAIHPNVVIWLCHMFPCCDSHSIESCEKNEEFRNHSITWSQMCNHLYIWHYIVDFAHYYNPFPNFRAMASDMRFYKRLGVEGIFAQGMSHPGGGGEFSLLRGYYCAKLLWDTDQDADEILKDFLRGYYGKAWESIWEYINLLHDEVEEKNIHMHLYVNPGHGHLSDEIVAKSGQLFDQAAAAVSEDPVLLDRVQVARMPIDYAKLFPRNGYRIENGRLVFNGETGGPAEAGKFIEKMRQHGFRSIRERFMSDPAQLLGMSVMLTDGLLVATLENDFLRVDVVLALASRILRIIDKKSCRCITAHNKVRSLWFPFTGGQENRLGELHSPYGWVEPAELVKQTTGSLTTRAKLKNGLVLERRISLPERNNLKIKSSVINTGQKVVDVRLRSHLELDLGDLHFTQISFVNKAGKQTAPQAEEIISGMREGIHYYEEEVPDGQLHFEYGGIEVTQSFDGRQVEFVSAHAFPEDMGDLEVELWLPIQKIAVEGKRSFEETIEVKS